MKFKLTEEILNKKLILEFHYLKRKLLLIKSLKILRLLMLLEQPKDMDLPELLKDSVLENYQEKLIEV